MLEEQVEVLMRRPRVEACSQSSQFKHRVAVAESGLGIKVNGERKGQVAPLGRFQLERIMYNQ